MDSQSQASVLTRGKTYHGSTWNANPLRVSAQSFNQDPGLPPMSPYGSVNPRTMDHYNQTINRSGSVPNFTNLDDAASYQQYSQSTFEKYGPSATPTAFNSKKKEFKNSCGLVTVSLFIDRTTHIAGGEITGRLELVCKSKSKVKMGNIEVEIQGFEEILDMKSPNKEEPKSRCFLNEVVVFQSLQMAPSDAIIGGTPDEHGMRLARKAVTYFDFKMRLPPTGNKGLEYGNNIPLPSSFWSKKWGGVRYVLSGMVEVKLNNGTPRTLKTNREVFVVEHCPMYQTLDFPVMAPTQSKNKASPLVATETKEVVVRQMFSKKTGEVTVTARVHVPELINNEEDEDYEEDGQSEALSTAKPLKPLGTWVAGGIGFVGVEINNTSAKKITSLKVSLVRRLKTFHRSPKSETFEQLAFSRQTLTSRTFHAQGGNNDAHHPMAGGDNKYCQGGGWWSEEDAILAARQGEAPVNEFWDGVSPSQKKMMMVDLTIPAFARSIRHAFFIDVSYVVNISIFTSSGNPLQVEIPVTILHPASFYTALPTLFITRASRIEYAYDSPQRHDEAPSAEAEIIRMPANHTMDINPKPSTTIPVPPPPPPVPFPQFTENPSMNQTPKAIKHTSSHQKEKTEEDEVSDMAETIVAGQAPYRPSTAPLLEKPLDFPTGMPGAFLEGFDTNGTMKSRFDRHKVTSVPAPRLDKSATMGSTLRRNRITVKPPQMTSEDRVVQEPEPIIPHPPKVIPNPSHLPEAPILLSRNKDSRRYGMILKSPPPPPPAQAAPVLQRSNTLKKLNIDGVIAEAKRQSQFEDTQQSSSLTLTLDDQQDEYRVTGTGTVTHGYTLQDQQVTTTMSPDRHSQRGEIVPSRQDTLTNMHSKETKFSSNNESVFDDLHNILSVI